MIKVVNGKRYNTQIAKEIARWDSGHYANDFSWHAETLYITIQGAYFVHGDGNANSPYSASCGDGRGGSEAIKPLTENEALVWCEKREIDEKIISSQFEGLVTDA